MNATYRLSESLAAFDFFPWMLMVQADGATQITLDKSNPKISKISFDLTLQRFENILMPGPALAGLPCRIGNERSEINAIASNIYTWAKTRKFQRLKTVKAPVDCKFTVTIRRNPTKKNRDSDAEEWYKFAEQIDAIVIEDYSVKPIHLHDRVALYAGAKRNFGVLNGCIFMATMTSYPVTMVVKDAARGHLAKWGVKPESPYPWLLPNQNMFWQEDTYDNLMRMFEGLDGI